LRSKDYDGVNEMILTDQEVEGQRRRLLTHFDRNGFGYTHAGGRVAGDDRHRPAVVARPLRRVPGRGVAGAVILTDQEVEGQRRRLLTHFDRNGFGYTLDRATGALLTIAIAQRLSPGRCAGFQVEGLPVP
jgi:glucose dehydrogenase